MAVCNNTLHYKQAIFLSLLLVVVIGLSWVHTNTTVGEGLLISAALVRNRTSTLMTSLLKKPEPSKSAGEMNAVVEDEKTDDVILNPPVTYTINAESACSAGEGKKLELAMLVHSAVTNLNRRNSTRKRPQGLYARKRLGEVAMIFFVGLPSDSLPNATESQALVRQESDRHGDIVQINVTDAYRNMVYKAIAVLQWASTYCANAKFVIKMDDDLYFEPEKLKLSLSLMTQNYEDFAMGELRRRRKPGRDRKSRWFMSVEEYPNSTYPPFLMGAVVGYPTSTFVRLYQVAMRTKTVWLDDVFVTGICTRKLGIPLVNSEYFSSLTVHKNSKKPEHFVYS